MDQTVLLVVDVTVGYLKFLSNLGLPDMDSVLLSYCDTWRQVIDKAKTNNHLVIGIYEVPTSSPHAYPKWLANSFDELYPKPYCSGAFANPELHRQLKDLGIQVVEICGLFRESCVAASYQQACQLGFKSQVLEHACISSAEIETLIGTKTPIRIAREGEPLKEGWS